MKSAPATPKIHKLPVGEGHTLHIEESGNPKGIPVISLHGGPGSQSKPEHALRFPLNLYRVILFDQRGSGKSTFQSLFKGNTTPHLLADIEKIRTYLNIEKWVVSGSSWGSTLSLAYAQAYPQHTQGLLISAVFLATAKELYWFSNPGGLARFYPQEYAELTHLLNNPTQANFFASLWAALTGPKAHAHKVSKAHALLDGMSMAPNAIRANILPALEGRDILKSTQLWAYYANHGFFLKPRQLVKNLPRLRKIPTFIAHGALDMCCPLEAAHLVHQALPHSVLTVVPMCGHRATPAMDKARRTAAISLAKQLKSQKPLAKPKK